MAARVPTRTAGAPVRVASGRTARRIPVVLDELPDGRVRVSTPLARGFAAVARGPHEMWRAMRQVMTEAQIAGYATWSGVRYEHDALTAADDPTEPAQRPFAPSRPGPPAVSWSKRSVCRPDVAHPSEWSPNPDGTWTSPTGRVWRSEGFIERLVEKRAALGLPTCHEDTMGRTA